MSLSTLQILSRQLVLYADITSTYSWSSFCAINCQPLFRKLPTFPHRVQGFTPLTSEVGDERVTNAPPCPPPPPPPPRQYEHKGPRDMYSQNTRICYTSQS